MVRQSFNGVRERESGGLDGEHVSFPMGPDQITQLSLLFISLLLIYIIFFPYYFVA